MRRRDSCKEMGRYTNEILRSPLCVLQQRARFYDCKVSTSDFFSQGPFDSPRHVCRGRSPERAPLLLIKSPTTLSVMGRVEGLREQDSNLQPCGYGMLLSFRWGPDYLITLRLGVSPCETPRSGCRALVGLIGENPHPLVSARSPLQSYPLCGASLRIAMPFSQGFRVP